MGTKGAFIAGIALVMALIAFSPAALTDQEPESAIVALVGQWVDGGENVAAVFSTLASSTGLCGSYVFEQNISGGSILANIPETAENKGLFAEYPGLKALDNGDLLLFAAYPWPGREFNYIVGSDGTPKKEFDNPSEADRMFGVGEDGKVYIAEKNTLKWYSPPWNGGPSGTIGTAPQKWYGFGGVGSGPGASALSVYSGSKYYTPVIDSRGKFVFNQYTLSGTYERTLEATDPSYHMAVAPSGDYYFLIFIKPSNSANWGYQVEVRNKAERDYQKSIDLRTAPSSWYSGGYFLPAKQMLVDDGGNIFILHQYGIKVFDNTGALLKNYLLNPNPGTFQGNQNQYLYNAYMMDFDNDGNLYVLSKADLAGNDVRVKKFVCAI
ncbi:hypothetical protein HYU14_05410 [Candidatus Woesearchaeota archaeon]|nr:hypothetical protein [Candidatus Woesearchaeota archaeon]